MSNTPEETQKTLDWAVQQLNICQKTKFYGKVTFIFEDGKIVRRTAESSEVPPKMVLQPSLKQPRQVSK
jgi:hypothetical protein